MDGFTAIAEPTRRLILDELRRGETDVGSLVDTLHVSQPLLSKHLRVLREVGVVTSEVAGRRRVYRIAHDPLPDVLAWIRPYEAMWADSFDRLDAAMNEEDPR